MPSLRFLLEYRQFYLPILSLHAILPPSLEKLLLAPMGSIEDPLTLRGASAILLVMIMQV